MASRRTRVSTSVSTRTPHGKTAKRFSEGIIRAIAQTPDGYLWLGTEFGLRRFDGVRAVPWEPPAGQQLHSSDIRSLQAARDGRLWIGTFRGLASWKDGKLSHYPELDGQVIEALLEDREGTIWVAGWAPSVGRLCRIQGGNIQCYGEDGRFGSGVTPLHEDSGGNLWAGAMNGLWRWKPGPPTLHPMPDPAQRIYALAESDDGGILIAKHSGVTKLLNGKTEAYPLPAVLQFQPHRLLRDRNGALWIGALVDSGLLHVHDGKADPFTTANGLSGASVTAIFEDREGSIWVATADGLDRFREFAITTISVQQGLSSQGFGSILTARDGSLWIGTSEGLNRWNQGQITIYRNRSQRGVRGASQPTGLIVGSGADWKRTVREIIDSGLPGRTAESIFQDHRGQIWVGTQSGVAFLKSGRFAPVTSVPYGVVHSITGDSAGNLWMSHQEGLFHLLEASLIERIPWTRLGRREPATALLHDARQGGVWLGFRDGGVAYFNDGQIRASYAAPEGLGEGMVRSFYPDARGSVWAATDGGLSRIKDGRVLTLTSQNGLPCNIVHWMMEDDADSVWLYTACGVVRIAQSDLDAWASNPKQTMQATVFDSSDGVSSRRFPGGYSANVAKSADGKLWFLRPGGISVIDPHHLAFNTLPPPVHIEQVTADDKIYDATNGLRLPARTRNLAIDYTALSLVAPEKMRFRYLLEGQDPDWKEVINDRQVQYSNLPPGAYRFRVVASNNSGVWNEAGATLDILDCAGVLPDPLVSGGDGGQLRRAAVGGVSMARRATGAAIQSDSWTRASASGPASRENCTIRCFRAFTVCCCSSRRRRTCCRNAQPRHESNWMALLFTPRRRSPKAATPCRGCEPRRSNATISRSRSGPWATRSRATRACSTAARHSASPSRGRRAICIRSSVTRSTRLRRKHSGTPSGMPGGASRGRDPLRRRAIPIARARRRQGDRSDGARRPGDRGPLRIAWHA